MTTEKCVGWFHRVDARLCEVDAQTLSLARQFSLWIGPRGATDWSTEDPALESIDHRLDVFARNWLAGVSLILIALVVTTFV